MKIGNIGNNSVATNVQKVEPATIPHSTSTQADSGVKAVHSSTQDSIVIFGSKSEENFSRNSEDVLDESLKQANQTLKQYNRVIDRTIHEGTKAVIYTIRDTKTNEVIAEFPSKKIQDMMAKMWEIAGMFIDDKA